MHFMQDPAAQLHAFMTRRRLSQVALADVAGVSQSTVSRALRNAPLRHGEARSRLFTYAQISQLEMRHEPQGRNRVLNAFNGIWDGSDVHADAVARIIEAMAGLRPVISKERDR